MANPILSYLDAATNNIAQARLLALGTPTGVVTDVPSNLQAALDAAAPGDTLLLTPGNLYTGPFTLGVKMGNTPITISTSATLPPGRVDPSQASLLPKILATSSGAAFRTAPGAHHWTLLGLELYPMSSYGDLLQLGDGSGAQTLLTQVPHDLIVDRCYIHGDPILGQKRGVALNSASTTILNCYISDCKAVGQDSQAVGGWNGPGPYTILNNYLEAAGENVMFGGTDSAIPNLVPSDITITGNTITKPLAWRPLGWQVKNLIELKNAQRVTITGNTLSNNWGQAQVGYAIVLTPRNQDGTAPWSTIQDVLFQNNTLAHSAAAIQLLGTDYTHPSGTLSRIKILNNTFTDIDPVAYAGSDKVFVSSNGGVDVTFDHNTIQGQNIGSILYFGGTPKALRMIYTNNSAPASTYGIFGGGSSVGGNPPHAWVDYVDSGIFSGNTP